MIKFDQVGACFFAIVLSLFVANPAFAEEEEAAEETAQEQLIKKDWNHTWHLQTSPLGDLAKRYNLEVGFFVAEQIELSLKGTRINHATHNLIDHDDGYEVGLKGTYYFPLATRGAVRLGASLGLFYANFQRGDVIGDLFGLVFQNDFFDRDEVKGVMVEGLLTMLMPVNSWLTLGGGAGLQTYNVAHYRVTASSGAQAERAASEQKFSPVIEMNVGVSF